MSENDLKKVSKTDWERVDAMSDEDIDTSDIPPLDEAFFANARVRLPKRKIPITVRLDSDVLTWFKGLGKGYQTHINAVLRHIWKLARNIHKTERCYLFIFSQA